MIYIRWCKLELFNLPSVFFGLLDRRLKERLINQTGPSVTAQKASPLSLQQFGAGGRTASLSDRVSQAIPWGNRNMRPVSGCHGLGIWACCKAELGDGKPPMCHSEFSPLRRSNQQFPPLALKDLYATRSKGHRY